MHRLNVYKSLNRIYMYKYDLNYYAFKFKAYRHIHIILMSLQLCR